MSPNTFNSYENCIAYCELAIALDQCKWWEFSKKSSYRDSMFFLYPLVRAEIDFAKSLVRNK